MIIEIRERTPVALVNTGEIKLVDRRGTILPLEEGETYLLPMIFCGESGGRKGRIDSASLSAACDFISRLRQDDSAWFDAITQIDISDSAAMLCLVTDPPARLVIGFDADGRQLRNLRYLLEALGRDRNVPVRIDLRYQNLAFVGRGESGPLSPSRGTGDL